MIFYELQYQITLWFQSISTPELDKFFIVITDLGDVTFLMLILTFMYWNVDKVKGLKMVIAVTLSFGVNTVLKIGFSNLRPFYTEGIEKGIPREIEGFSFPSGHSQNTGAAWTALIIEFRKNWIKVIGIILMVLIPLSRLYLRVHWLLDVVVGLGIGVIISILYYKYASDWFMKVITHKFTLTVITPLTFLVTSLVMNTDVAKGCGIFAGLLFGYWADDMWLNYQNEASLKTKVLRQVIGILVIMIIMEGLKVVFPEHYFYDYIRYYLVGMFVSFGGPLLFTKLLIRS